jgi:tripartite-type tricarboxylate transporter receptor subunit TctC
MALVWGQACVAEDFYKGKTIRLIVGFGPPSGFDVYSRLLAQYMPSHIPGRPNISVETMNGAGSVIAANYVYGVAPKDGTVVAIVDQGAPMHQLLGGSGAQFRSDDIQWLGSIAHSNGLTTTWHTSGVKTIEDAMKREVRIGGVAKSADSYVFPAILNAVLGTKFKIVLGYANGGQTFLAVERGEVAGNGASSWLGLMTSHRDWVEQKKVNILVQIGVEKEREIPDVPLLSDLVKDPEGRQISDLISVTTSIGYAYWVAPGVPKDRVATLRKAFDETVKDPDLLADAARRRLEVRPQSGAAIAERVERIARTPRAVLDRMAKVLDLHS